MNTNNTLKNKLINTVEENDSCKKMEFIKSNMVLTQHTLIT